MVWRAKRLLLVGWLGLSLLGCSLMGVRFGDAGEVPPDRLLRPGPGPVVVEGGHRGAARVSWYSPWRGSSVVRFATTPGLERAQTTAPTSGNRASLSGLVPGTRYYMQVETRTDLGTSRSSVCSFVTK
ncbi:MAG: fibronectin type III domain-containing protein [Candidatus Sericytochromatia bacterium]|nr:fibronectin type III domain-containing protein [Candidatus Sericytochromatia bacterium]